MILSSVDESVSVNSDGDCGGETGQFGFRFHRTLDYTPKGHSQNVKIWQFLSGRLLAILSGLELAVFQIFEICPDPGTAFSRPQICLDCGNSPSRGLKLAGRLPKSFWQGGIQ